MCARDSSNSDTDNERVKRLFLTYLIKQVKANNTYQLKDL
ncbi:hypothetical protein C7959_12558 [Orenia marismortui]|uniref:Uncharacterized protein n=1 Tax=Orenia marismortui TaxID=46469 RepID=A0A4R8GSK2_9FIRM|nr:hypothetical protein C7959_12558 [Orenia marismortui]